MIVKLSTFTLLVAMLIPSMAAAQTDDAEAFAVWESGNVTFEYPVDWVAGQPLRGVVVVANSDALIESVVGDPTEVLQAGDVVAVVINQTLMTTEMDIDPDDDLEDIALAVGATLDNLEPPPGIDRLLTTLGDDEAVRLTWQTNGFEVDQILIRRRMGLLGVIAVAPQGELADYDFLDHLAATLDYRLPLPIDALVLDATYQLPASNLHVDYPSHWFVFEEGGFIGVSNREDFEEIDEPETGDIAIILLDLNTLRDELGMEGELTAETVMQLMLAELGDEAEFREPTPVTLGDHKGLRTDAIIESDLRALMLSVDVRDNVVLLLAVTKVGSMGPYEALVLEIAASLR